MKKLSLAKQDLPPGWIGAAVGEPYLVKDHLFKIFSPPNIYETVKDFEYTKPQGYDPLVKFLENKHQAPVVITNGAKQAIGSLFYALKQKHVSCIYMRKPWWSLFPPLIKMHGLSEVSHPYSNKSAHLLVAPNNPDGIVDFNKVECQATKYTIHDAVYYNGIYMSPLCDFRNFGDVQVFSLSKTFGLSQLRLGYCVFHNMDLYNSVLEYMETMTVGASVLSQIYALELFQTIKSKPGAFSSFEVNCHNELVKNRKIANQIDNKILTVDQNQSGMFLWAKCHKLQAFEGAKVIVAEGTGFGMAGYIRMNLALPTDKIKEIVERLNNLK